MFRKLSLLVALALAAGCGGPVADPEFLDGAPEVDAYLSEVTGDASEGSSSSSLTADGDYSELESGLDGEGDDVVQYLRNARRGVAYLNGIVRAALAPIVEIIKENPDVVTGTKHVWGPRDRGTATYRFTMVKKADKKFGWKLEAKPQGAADDQYQVVMGGGIAVGAEKARRGKGVLGIDADALSAIDTTVKARGKLLCGFAHWKNGGKALGYLLKDFTPDVEKHPGLVSAAVRAVRGPLGGTLVRMTTFSDISDPADGKDELVRSRVRWLPGVGGRADGLVSLGSVETGHYLVVNSCWNATLDKGYKLIRKCPEGVTPAQCGASGVVVAEKGDKDNCVKIGELKDPKLPPADPAAPDAENSGEEGEEAADAPGAMPDGSGP